MEPLRMPQLALGGEALTVVDWLKRPGERFSLGEPLLEVESSKARMEVEAPRDGVLAATACGPGDELEPGTVIGWTAAVGESWDEAELAAVTAAEGGERADTAPPAVTETAPGGGTVAEALRPRPALVPHGELAGLPVGSPAGAGEAGARSALPAAEAPEAASPPLPDGARVVALSGRRAAIARQMTRAAAIPQFAVTRELVVPAGAGALSDALVVAAARAAARHPRLNAWLLDDRVVELASVDVAFAVDTPEGVVAPVVRGADQLGLTQLRDLRRDLVERARRGELRQQEITGASISVSNVGPLDADTLLPLLTPPQVAVLGLGRARPRGGGGDGSALVATLVCDHRALDGADGARYLATLAQELDALLASVGAAA